jgi:hypothetical protein
MFDLYLFNTIINTLWYLFTILFVLYKYTAFFSYIYNFVKFCGKLFSGVSYVYKYISGNNNLNRVDIESQNNQNNQNNNKTFYQKCKNYITKNYNYYYRKIFPNASVQMSTINTNTFVPLVETNYSSQIKFSTQLNTSSNEDVFTRQNDNNKDNIKELEQKLFIKKMNELQKSDLEHSELEQKYNIHTHTNKYPYEYTPIFEENEEKYFDENIKTNSILKNVTFNEKLNVSYGSGIVESNIDSDIDSDIDSNSELTIFYDL